MTLYFIGIGLHDEKDITVRGLEAIKKCAHIYLEYYTSILHCDKERLELFYEKKIILADRTMVEKHAEIMLNQAVTEDVAFLVIGDIFGATTHTDLMLRAKEKKIHIECIHNASILNAIGIVGLELYKFGKTTSIPFPSPGFEPETPYDVLKLNQSIGLHTLILLDLRPLENKFMSVSEGLKYLLQIENKRKENILTAKTMAIGCARIGGDFKIRYASIEELITEDFGGPLHCIIIPGKMHFIEEEALAIWKGN